MAMETPGEIEIADSGDAISAPDGETEYELRVETNDPTAQIVVLNDRFDTVIKAAGSVAQKLPAGIYKVRVQRGASSTGFEDKLVVLDRDCKISIEPPQLSSPTPMGRTRASDAHVAAREWLDAVVHVSVGRGSKIAVLARYAVPHQGSKSLPHPFRGLHLLRADGRVLVNLERSAPKTHFPDAGDPISVCGIQVDPGAYILRHQLSHGRQLSQSVIATGDWQITISIRRPQRDESADKDLLIEPLPPDMDPGKELFSQPGYVSLLMRRLINGQSAQHASARASKDGPIDDDRLVEVARQGLADGAQLLRGNLYDLLLRDFENPMAGIVGGLLLDREREAAGAEFAAEHAALFDVAVTKLRKMVGREHPDVEALSFRCQDSGIAHRGAINARPMFHRSWRMILEAAARRQNLVPLDLWRRTSASGSMPPYLIWSADQAGKQARLQRLRKTASELSTQRVVLTNSPDSEREPQPPMASARLESVASPTADTGFTPVPSGTDRPKAGSAPPASTMYKPKTAKISREEIALEMGVPANALSHLIEWSKPLARALRKSMRVAKSSEKSGARAAGSFAAKKVTAKSATPGTAKSEANKPGAKRTGSAGVKAVYKKAAAVTKGVSSVGRFASTKAKAGAKSARRSSRRKPARG